MIRPSLEPTHAMLSNLGRHLRARMDVKWINNNPKKEYISDAQWPGEKRASFFWLVEFKGHPSQKKSRKKGTTEQLGDGKATSGCVAVASAQHPGPCPTGFGARMSRFGARISKKIRGSKGAKTVHRCEDLHVKENQDQLLHILGIVLQNDRSLKGARRYQSANERTYLQMSRNKKY